MESQRRHDASHPGTDQQSDVPPRHRCQRLLSAIVALAVIAGSSIALTGTASAANTVRVRGTVACPSGMPVVGVWVESSGGGSGFADWTRYPGAETVARFSRTLSTGSTTSIYLNVGCGGTKANWGSSSRTPTKKFTVGSGYAVFYNAECGAVGSCKLFPMENNTPAAPASSWFPKSQCTGRAADFWKRMTGRFPNWGGDAHAWDDNAAATGWAVRSWPRPDSIAVWQKNMASSGPYGHVAYVADTRVSSGVLQMKIYDRNWGPDRNGVWVNFVKGMKFIIPPARSGVGDRL